MPLDAITCSYKVPLYSQQVFLSAIPSLYTFLYKDMFANFIFYNPVPNLYGGVKHVQEQNIVIIIVHHI